MIAAAARGQKQVAEIGEGLLPPLSIEVWDRYAAPCLLAPLVWIIAVSFTSSEDRLPKTSLSLLIVGILITAFLIVSAVILLGDLIDVTAGGMHTSG